MERESFLFYKSFYEAVKPLPKDIQAEIYTAIMEYALYGNLPEKLKPVAHSVFTLVKPILDTNLQRYENGKKGASFGKRGGRPRMQSPASAEKYTLTFEQEVERMKTDEDWKKTICSDFNLSPEDYDAQLTRFLRHCNDEKKRKGKDHHDSYMDAQSHLRYWMTKAYPQQTNPTNQSTPPGADSSAMPFPEIGEDFGGVDYDEQPL